MAQGTAFLGLFPQDNTLSPRKGAAGGLIVSLFSAKSPTQSGCQVAWLGGGCLHRVETSRVGVRAGPERGKHMPSYGARGLGKGHESQLPTAAAGRVPHTLCGSRTRAKPVAPRGRLTLQ